MFEINKIHCFFRFFSSHTLLFFTRKQCFQYQMFEINEICCFSSFLVHKLSVLSVKKFCRSQMFEINKIHCFLGFSAHTLCCFSLENSVFSTRCSKLNCFSFFCVFLSQYVNFYNISSFHHWTKQKFSSFHHFIIEQNV